MGGGGKCGGRGDGEVVKASLSFGVGVGVAFGWGGEGQVGGWSRPGWSRWMVGVRCFGRS